DEVLAGHATRKFETARTARPPECLGARLECRQWTDKAGHDVIVAGGTGAGATDRNAGLRSAAISSAPPISTSNATRTQPGRPGSPSTYTPVRRPAHAPSHMSPMNTRRPRYAAGSRAVSSVKTPITTNKPP